MNRDALNELYDFTTFSWETYARALKGLPAEELVRPIEGSGWASLLQPLTHIACAWDGWLSEKAGEAFTEFDIEGITMWEEVQQLRTQTRGWMRRILDEMSDAALFEDLSPTWDAQPDASKSSNADVLLHILLHERGHHGDVSTLLANAAKPLGDGEYLVYQFFRNSRGSRAR